MLGKIEGGGGRRRGRQRMRWLDDITDSMDMSLSTNSGSWWWTRKPGVLQSMGSQRVRQDWATEQQQQWPLIPTEKLWHIVYFPPCTRQYLPGPFIHLSGCWSSRLTHEMLLTFWRGLLVMSLPSYYFWSKKHWLIFAINAQKQAFCGGIFPTYESHLTVAFYVLTSRICQTIQSFTETSKI